MLTADEKLEIETIQTAINHIPCKPSGYMSRMNSKRDQVLMYACDKCGALPGEICITTSGSRTSNLHSDRVSKAVAAWEQEYGGLEERLRLRMAKVLARDV